MKNKTSRRGRSTSVSHSGRKSALKGVERRGKKHVSREKNVVSAAGY